MAELETRKESVSFEEYLKEHEELTYTCRGRSMLPMLREKQDLVTIRRKENKPLKKYGVALFLRAPKTYVLHRVVAVDETGYTFRGDNCVSEEKGIKEDQILGVLTSFKRKGKSISVENNGYRLYAHLVVILYPVRKLRIRILTKARKLVKR